MTQRTEIPRSDRQGAQAHYREIQLFEPPSGALYTIEAASRIVDVPRRTILVYCKDHLLSPATNKADHGYYFDRDAIRALRRIEALGLFAATICGIRIILDLTAVLERLRSDTRLLSRGADSWRKDDCKVFSASPRRINVRSGSRRKRK